MSKAFTSEETPDDPVLGRPVARVLRGQERPITLEGYRALVHEQENLKKERLEEKKDEVRKQQLDHRLALISATLENVKVVNVPPADGMVHFGSTVTLAWEDGKQQTLRLVGPDEAGGDSISVESPLARVLLEQREGDEVEVVRPRGVSGATLLKVR